MGQIAPFLSCSIKGFSGVYTMPTALYKAFTNLFYKNLFAIYDEDGRKRKAADQKVKNTVEG